MSATAREIEDPVAYVKLEMKKIESVQGLEQLVGSNQIKRDRADWAKQKFEDLRKALSRKIQEERKSQGEVVELEEQLKKAKVDLAKLIKQAGEEAVTMSLVREDAEQAESEAGLAREREQLLMMEAAEMQRIRDDLKKRIEQIQFDFFEAMVPILGRLQIEVKQASEQIVEDTSKQEEVKKQIEDAKVRKVELDEEIKVIVANKFEILNKLESLAGLPEKYTKQCDILLNVLQSVKAQNLKWDGKFLQEHRRHV
ncbi:hypothetical protein KC19_VG072600 [Ceratodon purpureus]|uniref:Uncharacterized protein n=1 Tax=Ceratodon purpureus TaxID=3225 RepID=A0A8T0HMU9_CERPU|nr:hypothetical protein KC19_VG072600 [Ceratodon purpureus]